MTITVGPSLGLTAFGPGLPMLLSSTVPPPYAAGTNWTVQFSLQPSGIDPFLNYVGPATSANVGLYVYIPPSGWTEHFQGWNVAEGQAIYVTATLGSSTLTLDTGNTTSTWDALSGLGLLIKVVAGSGSTSVHTIDDVWNSVNRIFGS